MVATTRPPEAGLDAEGIERLRVLIDGHVLADRVGGATWLVARGDDVAVGVSGKLTRGEQAPVERDSLFRLSSMTKPIVAAAAMILVEECRLRLDDPVDDLLPELADRRVLVDPLGPLDGPTVPAERPITVHDVLTFRLGLGIDFAAPWPQPLLEAMADLDLGAAPPAPQLPPSPDEWLHRLGTLPLLHQPGERWLYDTGADVLGVLITRAVGAPLQVVLRERLFEPLAMVDTDFAATETRRLGTCYGRHPDSGELWVFDPPDGQWAQAPAFPSGGAGLVSTVDDVHRFAQMLLAGGRLRDGSRLLSAASVAAMTTDQIGGPGHAAGPSADGFLGWGFGVGVTVRRTGLVNPVGSYGWSGGLGSSWSNDPASGLIGVILTTDMFAGPSAPPAVIQDFWTGAVTALAD